MPHGPTTNLGVEKTASSRSRYANEADCSRAARYTWPLFKSALESGKTLTLPVHGHCMWPTLKPGDRVRIRRLEPDRIRVGDILVCVYGNRALVHRAAVLGFDAEGEPVVRCKGDAARSLDAAVRVRDAYGVVVGVERKNRPISIRPKPGLSSVLVCQLRSAFAVARTFRLRA